MDPTNARKTVILAWLFVLGVLFVGGLSTGNHVPSPKKFFGSSVAYLALAIGADFAAPVVVAFAFAFAFYILLQNTGSLTGLETLTGTGSGTPTSTAGTGANGAKIQSVANPSNPTSAAQIAHGV